MTGRIFGALGSVNLSGVFGAMLIADRATPGDPVTADTDDLELFFAGFGSGTLFNAASPGTDA